MPQTLGIPKLNNIMFLSKKYQRSKQLQSNVPNAMTKALKLSCWASKGKLQLWLGKSGIISKLGRVYSCKSRRESTTVSRMGCKTRDAEQEKILLCVHVCVCMCVYSRQNGEGQGAVKCRFAIIHLWWSLQMRRWFPSQGHSGHQLGGRQSEWFLSKGMDWLGLGKQVTCA